ncbi:MAG: 4Fe-4S dicluster domain-containing protein [Spirochaetales bacterium]|nr:4Fe-4S dicluster domain-containing protein [Spirochaetales bacterium]
MLKVLDTAELGTWVEAIIKAHDVIGIQARADKFDFGPLAKVQDLRLDYDVSLNAPKRFFLLPDEKLFTFKKDEAKSAQAAEPFVLFGVHPYDLIALRQLDKLFEMDNPDVHYLSRRAKAIVVAVDVQKPSAHVFAGCLGFEHVEDSYDILLTKIGNEYLADAATAAGEKLIALGKGFTKADDTHLAARKKIWDENKQALRRHELKPNKAQITAQLEKSYDHKIWKEKARLCFSCGSCNLVCPTCYCFDVADRLNWDLASGERVRTWDGCMLEDFATVAGPHNFRNQREARYRHRYYRKGKYVPDKIGEFSCVGCGRCIGACVTHIANPVEVYNAIMEA